MGTMINRRRVMGKKGLLPSGYTQVEYIENTSTAYINTGVVGATNLIYEANQQILSTGAEGMNQSLLYFFIGGRNNRIYAGFQNDFRESAEPLNDGNFHKYVLNNVNCTVLKDGRTIMQFSNKSTSSFVFYMFDVMTSKVSYNIKIKKKYAILWRGNTLIRNYIPCISPNNVVGMYDTVEGKFYSSPNGVAFIAGPVV